MLFLLFYYLFDDTFELVDNIMLLLPLLLSSYIIFDPNLSTIFSLNTGTSLILSYITIFSLTTIFSTTTSTGTGILTYFLLSINIGYIRFCLYHNNRLIDWMIFFLLLSCYFCYFCYFRGSYSMVAIYFNKLCYINWVNCYRCECGLMVVLLLVLLLSLL